MHKILLTLALSCMFVNIQAQKISYETVFKLLTGGLHAPAQKTWMIDGSPAAYHYIGPPTDTTTYYYSYPEGLDNDSAWIHGALQNAYTFRADSIYHPKNTTVTGKALFADKYFGYHQPLYSDVSMVDPDHKDAPFTISYSPTLLGTGYSITIQNNSYIGYFEKRYTYDIMRITEDTMHLGQHFNDDTTGSPQDDPTEIYLSYYAVNTVVAGVAKSESTPEDIFFYPNPAKETIFFHKAIVSAVVYNQLGNTVLSGGGNSLEVGSLMPGLYQVQAKDAAGKFYLQKLLKQ